MIKYDFNGMRDVVMCFLVGGRNKSCTVIRLSKLNEHNNSYDDLVMVSFIDFFASSLDTVSLAPGFGLA